ncbi:MAG: SpoIIE family protein phosphatase [Gracilibacteraceae bacterium]|jgi:sigma-B regulation protein RsbU (phosphoserine phosphatase)|nr:SpoIIE family protein phosphatase [Gracilibacteraceae bacterium]
MTTSKTAENAENAKTPQIANTPKTAAKAKKSIKRKILLSFLLVCIAALVLSGAISTVQLRQIRDIAVKANMEIGSLAGEKSAQSLVNLSLDDLQSLAEEKGAAINVMLETYEDELALMADYIRSIYENPADYRPMEVIACNAVPADALALHYFLEPDFGARYELETSGLKDETYLLGNAEKIFSAQMKVHPEINTIVISTASGQNLQYDKDAFAKTVFLDTEPRFVAHDRDWYAQAKENAGLYISDTYQDGMGRGLTLTMSMPFYANGIFKGVVGFDVGIGELDEQIKTATVAGDGYIELLGGDRVISSPELIKRPDAPLPPYWEAVRATGSGSLRAGLVFAAWSGVELTGWKIVYVVPERNIIAPAVELSGAISVMTADASSAADARILSAILLTVALLLVIAVLAAGAAYQAAAKISEPVSVLTQGAKLIGSGNLEHRLAISTGDELETLAVTINKMVADIKKITGEKERIDAELNVAANIQTSMLPHIFPAFPDTEEFDIYAAMIPAKEVGGDFYDFFMDENHVWTVMADVSDKGVHAALFMVIAKTLLKNNAQSGMSPKEVLEVTNNILCEDNEAEMFVTVFIGRLDLKTGVYAFANGGHERPLLRRRGEDWRQIKIKSKPPLGTIENIKHIEEQFQLYPGDSIFLYTDGVTEAENKEHAPFGGARLTDCLNQRAEDDLSAILPGIKTDIDAFTDGAAQFDDITMLIMTYRGDGDHADNP